jgi:hypothetical protein
MALATFITHSGIRIDILMTGEYPGDSKPKPVVFPDPSSVSQSKAGIQIIRLDALVELRLPRTLGESLNPYVREKYYSLWDGVESDRVNQSRPDYEPDPRGHEY